MLVPRLLCADSFHVVLLLRKTQRLPTVLRIRQNWFSHYARPTTLVPPHNPPLPRALHRNSLIDVLSQIPSTHRFISTPTTSLARNDLFLNEQALPLLSHPGSKCTSLIFFPTIRSILKHKEMQSEDLGQMV